MSLRESICKILFSMDAETNGWKPRAKKLVAELRSSGLLWIILLIALSAGDVDAQIKPGAGEQQSAKNQAPQATALPAVEQKLDQASDAARISGIGQLYEMDRRRLKQVQAEQQKVENEYKDAAKEFEQLDKALIEKKEQLKGDDGTPITASAQKQLIALEKNWQLAKERFDLVIQQRKALQAQMAILDYKIRLEKAALDRLSGATEKKMLSAKPSATTVQSAAPAAEGEGSESIGLESFGLPGLKTTPAQKTQQAAPGTEQPPESADQELPTEALLQAREDLQEKRLELKDAKERLQEIDRAIKVFDSELKAEQQLLQIARKQADNAAQTSRALKEDMSASFDQQATRAELRRRSQDAERRLQQFSDEVAQRTAQAEELQPHLDRIRNARATTEAQYQEAIAAVDSARQKVEWLESPVAPQRIYHWFIKSGPKILASVLFIATLLWLSRVLGHRIVRAVASRSGPGSIEEREKRSETLIGVFNNGTTVAIVVFGTLMLLQASGINVSVLLGGAAVVGVAVAFGAQNLTRDYFSGFVMLLENQYGVNDIVRIGGIAGLVERITLRMTVLRDLEGVVHFIPHGEVKTVSNLTQGWSRALFDIGVAYKEDADRVMKVLVELGKELRQDPYYGDLIMDDPEMLGVDSFGDSAVVIKFFIKTRPQKQFTIKRELLRRIKRKFDELGIEIPFPHRTVYHRSGDNSPVNRNGPVTEAIVGDTREV